jgi:hypothetical protein
VLLSYPWPGNVRELENVIERAVALAEGDSIGPADLPPQVRERRSADVLQGALQRSLTLAELEREYIHRVLQAEGGNKTRAAQRLGLDRKTLYRKLDEYTRPNTGDIDTDEQAAMPAAPITTPVRGSAVMSEPRERRITPPPSATKTAPLHALPPVAPAADETTGTMRRLEATMPIERVEADDD